MALEDDVHEKDAVVDPPSVFLAVPTCGIASINDVWGQSERVHNNSSSNKRQ
jgi:uncharacterized protein YoxC